MAAPQIENGYTRIANELLEAVCRLNISGSEMRILLYIIRRTYGFNRIYAEMPLTEIAEAVGMKTTHVSRALKKLREINLIELHPSKGIKPQTISIVKDYQKWAVESCTELLLPKMVTVTNSGNPSITNFGNPSITNFGNPTITNFGNHTYKENKERYKERGKESRPPSGRYGNCFLSQSQYDELVSSFGKETVDRYIDKVDCHVQSTGKRYSDFSAVIRKWIVEDGADKKQQQAIDYNSVYGQFVNDFINDFITEEDKPYG
jgi:phage replication O-like protein O